MPFVHLSEEGLEQYEISNFGRYRSEHNMGYWKYKDYIGLGSGAVGFLKDRRFYPTQDVEAYVENPLQIQTEVLSQDSIKTEKIFLGLRSCIGIDESILTTDELQRAKLLVEEKKLIYSEKRFYNSDYLLSDEIALFIEN